MKGEERWRERCNGKATEDVGNVTYHNHPAILGHHVHHFVLERLKIRHG